MSKKVWVTTVVVIGVVGAVGLAGWHMLHRAPIQFPNLANLGATNGVTDYGYRTIPFAKPFLPTNHDILINGVRVAKGVLQPLPASAKGVSPKMYKEDQLVLLGALESDVNGLKNGSFHAAPLKGATINEIGFAKVVADTGLSTKGIVFNLELTVNGKKQIGQMWTATDATRYSIGFTG